MGKTETIQTETQRKEIMQSEKKWNRILRRKKRWGKHSLPATISCLLLAAVVCLPLFLIPTGAFTGTAELRRQLAPVLGNETGYAVWYVLPLYPTLEHFRKLLLEAPEFYQLFWNSVRMTALSLAGQLVIGAPSAWAFSFFRFRGRRILFGLYIVLLLMPFQVMLLPQYLALTNLGLYNTPAAIVLPLIFSGFPVFLMYQGFVQIDREILESARLDGAGEWQIFFRIGLPVGKAGIQSALVLGFLECWNLVEQPMAFLEEQSMWPLSLYLPQLGMEQAGYAFAVSVIVLIPALFVYALGQDALVDGIAVMTMKR